MIATNRIELGARLRLERDRLRLTQDEMADSTGVSKRTQAAWEKGEQVPHAEYLALAGGLGLDILFVVTGQRIYQMQAQTMGVQMDSDEFDLLTAYRACTPEDRALVRRMTRAVSTR